ncbi:hypothetical protein [Streptomyces griseoaurantiacus]|uniref:hypothetical protein n=1 Tax=Streptomyces griseoaurantiacus TaxID=68213 RepID=UPI0037A473E9
MTTSSRQRGTAPPGPPTPLSAPASATAAPTAPRRTAFAEGFDRLRHAAGTEPGRLRLIGALLALLVLAFGAAGAWQMSDRATAADDVLHRSQPLSAGAAEIYRSLADANTAAAGGFLAGGQEPAAVRERYENDLETAATKLVTAAAAADPGSPAAATIAGLNRLLPQYEGLIERARANNRLGYPVGGAYLRAANAMMQDRMLPAAQDLYTKENQRLRADYADATPYPWLALALGVAALAALAWAQRRHYRRTNRVLNRGLVAATAASAAVLLWMTVGHTVARAGLDSSYEHGIRSLSVLHDARIASLNARGNENLTLVSRGAETKKLADGDVVDLYDYDFGQEMKALAAGLAHAETLADDSAGREPVRAATGNMKVWRERHTVAREADDAGDYQGALDKVIGGDGDKGAEPTGECFDSVDKNLGLAVDHEESEFHRAAAGGRDALGGLPAGAAVLAVLGAAGAVLGIGRRLSEYR